MQSQEEETKIQDSYFQSIPIKLLRKTASYYSLMFIYESETVSCVVVPFHMEIKTVYSRLGTLLECKSMWIQATCGWAGHICMSANFECRSLYNLSKTNKQTKNLLSLVTAIKCFFVFCVSWVFLCSILLSPILFLEIVVLLSSWSFLTQSISEWEILLKRWSHHPSRGRITEL